MKFCNRKHRIFLLRLYFNYEFVNFYIINATQILCKKIRRFCTKLQGVLCAVLPIICTSRDIHRTKDTSDEFQLQQPVLFTNELQSVHSGTVGLDS